MALKFVTPTGYLTNATRGTVDGTVTGNVALFGWLNMQTVGGTVVLGAFNTASNEGYYVEYNNAFSSIRATWISGGSFQGTNASVGGASTNTWYAVGGNFAFSGGNITADCWRNGVKNAGSPTAIARPVGLSHTNIGAFGGAPSGFYPSTFGLCAAWNRSLTDAEWTYLSQGGSPFDLDQTNLVGVWDPYNVSTVIDQSGHSNDLTLFGTPVEALGGPYGPLVRPRLYGFPNSNATASDFSLSTPAAIVAGGTTGSINITPNGIVGTANATFAFSDGGAGGTFAPTSQTITNGSGGAVSFTYTAPGGALPGTIPITVTAGGGSSITNGTNHTTNITVVASASSVATSVLPTSIGSGGTVAVTYTLDAPAPHGGVVITCTRSGVPGGTFASPTVTIAELGTTGSVNFTAGGGTGTETLSGTSVPTLTFTPATLGVSSSPLAAGTLSVGSITLANTIPLSSTSPSGGTPPYSMQIFRSQVDYPSSSLPVSSNAGAVPGVAVAPAAWGGSQTVTDRLAAYGRKYYYQAVYTDTVGGTVVSNQVNGTALPLKIGVIGDSIYHNDHSTGPTGVIGNATAGVLGGMTGQLQRTLQNYCDSGTVSITNQAVPGASTLDWVTGSGNNYYPAASAAFTSAGCNVFTIMLGTNDANTSASGPQTPANVKSRLTSLINQLKADFPGAMIFLHCPPWLDGTRFGAPYVASTINALRGYVTVYASLCDYQTVFPGDFNAINFINAANEGSTSANGFLFDGVHPNDSGYALIGPMQAHAMARFLFPQFFARPVGIGGF